MAEPLSTQADTSAGLSEGRMSPGLKRWNPTWMKSRRHRVNGKIMVIVLDDMENIEREKKMKSNMDGIYTRQPLFSRRSWEQLCDTGAVSLVRPAH